MLNYLTSSTIYVSQTEGNDDWTGFCDTPQPQYGFGPLQTVERAVNKIAKMRVTGNGQPMNICIMGDYCLEGPLRLGSACYGDIDGLEAGTFPSGDLVVESHPVRKGRIIGGRMGRLASEAVQTGVSVAQTRTGEVTVTVPAGYRFFIVKQQR